MRIKKIIHQNRRDFRAIYECEFCGHTKEDRGYDDDYFHQTVIPNMKCQGCGKQSLKQSSVSSTPSHIEM